MEQWQPKVYGKEANKIIGHTSVVSIKDWIHKVV